VGVAAEALAFRLELVAQLPEVVDLAVEHDDVAAVGRMHRLVAGLREVDDGEPAEPQARLAFAPRRVLVRTPVLQAGDGVVEPHVAAAGEDRADDAAHQPPPMRIASSRAAFAAQVNSARARALALAPSAASRARSASADAIASRHAGTDPGGSSRPVSPSTTISGSPPLSDASTGSPHAIASTTLMPNASSPIEGCTNTSHCDSRSGRSACRTRPMKRTRSSSPAAAAARRSACASGPSPTTR